MSVVGEVRKSEDGVYALCATDVSSPVSGKWLLSKPETGSYWARDNDVAGWETVFEPDQPIGIVMHRVYGDDPEEFEVAVNTNSGWVWIDGDGAVTQNCNAPYDDESGKWKAVKVTAD